MYLTFIKDGFKIKVYHNVLMVVHTFKNVKVANATYCLVDCVSYLYSTLQTLRFHNPQGYTRMFYAGP